MAKKEDSYPKTITLGSGETLNVTYEDLSREEAKYDFPPLPEEAQKLLSELSQEIETNPGRIQSENSYCIRGLNSLKQKYPENPQILNSLLFAYVILGDEEKARTLARTTYEKFPNYLFALTAEVIFSLNADEDEKASSILSKYSSLKDLYPNRELFHITEVIAFSHAKVQLACKLGNLEEAERELAVLKQSPIDHSLVSDAEDAVVRLQKEMATT